MALISLIRAVNWGGGQGECRVQALRAKGELGVWCWLLQGLFQGEQSASSGWSYCRVSSSRLAVSAGGALGCLWPPFPAALSAQPIPGPGWDDPSPPRPGARNGSSAKGKQARTGIRLGGQRGRHSRLGGLQVGERARSRAKVTAVFFDTSTFHPHPKNLLRGSPTNVPKKGRKSSNTPPPPQFSHSAPPRPVLISLSFSFPCTTFLLSFLLFTLENPGDPQGLLPEKNRNRGK